MRGHRWGFGRKVGRGGKKAKRQGEKLRLQLRSRAEQTDASGTLEKRGCRVRGV